MTPAKGHYLTPRGYLVLVKFGKLRVGARFRLERYSPFIFRHRMACAKVGLALEKHPLIREFRPEFLLRKGLRNEAAKLCDAELLYSVPGQDGAEKVGLEVELTLKSSDRLLESFERLNGRELDQVWWICGDETIRNALRRQLIDRPGRFQVQRHFFCLLEDFLAAKQQACLIDAHGQEFIIDPAGATLRPRAPEPPPPAPTTLAKPLVEAPPQHAPAATQNEPITLPSPAKSPPAASYRDTSWIQSQLEDLWIWFIHDFMSDFTGQDDYYDSRERDEKIRRRAFKLVLMLAATICFALAVNESVTQIERLLDGTRGWSNWLSDATPPPQPVWTTRRLRGGGIDGKDYSVRFLSFRSSGRRYRFKFSVTSRHAWFGGQESGFCGLAVQDIAGHTFARRTWKYVQFAPISPDPQLEFTGPRGMDRFFLVVSDDAPICGKTGEGESFLVLID